MGLDCQSLASDSSVCLHPACELLSDFVNHILCVVAASLAVLTTIIRTQDQVLLVIEALKSHGMIIQPQMIESKRVPPLPQFPSQTGEMSDPSSCVASHRAESLGSLYVGDDMDRPLSVAGDPNRPLSFSENSSYQQLASAY